MSYNSAWLVQSSSVVLFVSQVLYLARCLVGLKVWLQMLNLLKQLPLLSPSDQLLFFVMGEILQYIIEYISFVLVASRLSTSIQL